MSLRRFLREPSEWTLEDVERIIAEKIPEGQRVEYKAALLLESKKQKIELAKDVSGLANSQGGWIIFGVAEGDDPEPTPDALSPLPGAGLQTRLEDILDSALEPIPDYTATTIDAGNGVVLVVRVERAAGHPIMVQGYDQHRYFVRSGTRTRPMNATEVSSAHAAAQSHAQRIEQRLTGLPLLANLTSETRIPPMDSMDATPVVCLVVAAVDGPDELIGRSQITRDAFQESYDGYRGKHGVRTGHRWTINAYGLVDEERDPPPSGIETFPTIHQINEDDDRLKFHRVGIYRSGVVEWAHRYPEPSVLPVTSMANDVHDALLFAARAFDGIGYVGRLKVWLTIEHAETAILGLPTSWDFPPAGTFLLNLLASIH